MKTYKEATVILSDLVFINDDRIIGYQKALKIINDNSSHESVFKRMIQQSIDNRQELISMRESIGNEPGPDNADSGEIYNVWMDVRSQYKGDADVASLELCEYNEHAAQEAYQKALDLYINLPQATRELITRQKEDLKESHDLIKTEWAMEKALS